MKTLLLYLTLTILLLFGCKETIIEERIPKEYTNDLLHADLIGTVLPATSKAMVYISQTTIVDSQQIDPANGTFTFHDLRSGNYDVIIRSNSFRTFKKTNLQLDGGNIVYLGEITLSTIPDEIESHYPADSDEIVYDWRYGRITISVLFNQSMDRVSVEKAFSTSPASEGIFTWGYYTTLPYGGLYNAPNDLKFSDGFDRGATITTFSKVKSMTYTFSRKDSYVDSTYDVTIGTGAKDSSGKAIRFPLKFTFKTVQSYVTQSGIQTTPVHGDINVSPITYSGISLRFPRRMDKQSTEDAISITPSMNKVFLWGEENSLSLFTGGPFLSDTLITVFVDSTAKDKDGIKLGHRFSFSFRTAPVELNYSYPNNGEVYVSTSRTIQMNFNTYVDLVSVKNGCSISPAVAGTFSYYNYGSYDAPNQVIFTPNSTLQLNTKYTVTLSTEVKDIYGIPMKTPASFSFITRPN
ncbi:MAG: Ig-like domain-containing protein [Bacteriovoracaceae bacterium]|nr:Ig-like domain-containing protein [Bacteroidota bacterium]